MIITTDTHQTQARGRDIGLTRHHDFTHNSSSSGLIGGLNLLACHKLRLHGQLQLPRNSNRFGCKGMESDGLLGFGRSSVVVVGRGMRLRFPTDSLMASLTGQSRPLQSSAPLGRLVALQRVGGSPASAHLCRRDTQHPLRPPTAAWLAAGCGVC